MGKPGPEPGEYRAALGWSTLEESILLGCLGLQPAGSAARGQLGQPGWGGGSGPSCVICCLIPPPGVIIVSHITGIQREQVGNTCHELFEILNLWSPIEALFGGQETYICGTGPGPTWPGYGFPHISTTCCTPRSPPLPPAGSLGYLGLPGVSRSGTVQYLG